jgi:curved DNA-binding protein CbpA
LTSAESIFGESKPALKEMSRRSLARLYRRRAQRFHPDKGGDHEKFVKLTRAYHALLKTKN